MKITTQDRNVALLENIDQLPITLAPKPIVDAANLAEKARLAFNSAEAIAMLAPTKVSNAERAWDIVAEQSVRAGGDLPPKSGIERATINKKIADADLVTVTRLLATTTQKVGATFADENLRAEWVNACEQRATELRTKLLEHVAQLRPLWRELSLLNGAVEYLDQFGLILTPPPGLVGDPFIILTEATTIKPTQTITQGASA